VTLSDRRERARLRSERWRRAHGIGPRRPAQKPWLAEGVSRSWYRRGEVAREREALAARAGAKPSDVRAGGRMDSDVIELPTSICRGKHQTLSLAAIRSLPFRQFVIDSPSSGAMTFGKHIMFVRWFGNKKQFFQLKSLF